MEDTVVTAEGLQRLRERLERLKTVGRRAMTERLRQAAETDADPTANEDHLIALEEQAALEAEIAQLERRIAAAQVGRPDETNDVVDLGESVRLRDVKTHDEVRCEIVGTLESDFRSGRISATSPVGRAVIGRRVGDVVTVRAPMGLLRYEILEISRPRRR